MKMADHDEPTLSAENPPDLHPSAHRSVLFILFRGLSGAGGMAH